MMRFTGYAPSRAPTPSPAPGRPLRQVGAFLGFALSLCQALSAQEPEPLLERYDLSDDAGIQVGLPRALHEVSGLATTPDGRLFAHNDERAIVYQVDPATGEILKGFSVGRMGIPGDFEGLAIAGNRFFLLTSRGQLLEFEEGEHASAVRYRSHSTGLANVCELEGLAFDQVSNELLLPCKTPLARSLRDHLVVFSLPLDSLRVLRTPRIFISLEDLDARGLDDEFHPSSIEVHPGTRSIVLLAAREEAMVELSQEGEILATEEMKRRIHPQPEGLAFLPDGALVLADEGRDGPGTLTRYYGKKGEDGGRQP